MAKNLEQITKLRKDFERAVNGYVAAFLKQFDLDTSYCWWVGDRIGIDNFCFADIHCVTLDELIFIVEEGVTKDEFLEWEDYMLFAHEFNLNRINLRSWHMGYHGIPKEDQERLRRMKQDLADAVEEYKKTNNPY